MIRSAIALLAALAILVAPAAGFAKRRRPKRAAPPPPSGILVYSLTEGATVEIDGKVVGTIPIEGLVALEPGPHNIRVSMRGFTERTEVIVVEAGQTAELEVDLLPFAGLVKLESNAASAQLWLDGKPFADLPFDGEIPMGRHALRAVAPGHLPTEQLVEIEGGREYAFRLDLVPAPAQRDADTSSGGVFSTWWFWTAAGVVVASGIAAAIALGSGGTTPLPPVDATVDM